MIRQFFVLAFCLVLSACGNTAVNDLDKPVEPLGDFRLGHAGVVAPNLTKLLVSRDATQKEWIDSVDGALEKRFRRFEGDSFYHLGISVEAYSLPPPVIPGKSALALRVTLWDDATQSKMNEETKLIHVIQVFESRLSLTREEQIERLSDQAARDIEKWLREEMAENGWFAAQSDEAQPDDPEAPPEPEVKELDVSDEEIVEIQDPDDGEDALDKQQDEEQPAES
jgi:hypothetical protein